MTNNDTYRLPIGIRSEGTLRQQDIAAAMLEDIDDLTRRGLWEHSTLRGELRGVANGLVEDDGAEIINDAMDCLQDHVPPFCFYGYDGGDGACLGVLIDWEAIETAEHDGELLRVADLSEVDDEWSGCVLLVNDHGNASLYVPRREFVEAWAVV